MNQNTAQTTPETSQHTVSNSAPPIALDGCDTLAKLFWHRVQNFPTKVAVREKDFGIWNEYRWADWGEQARLAGLGLTALGLTRGDVCSIASEVNKEWMFADQGIIGAGGVVNGVYPTDVAEQVEYLITDSRSVFYFAEDEEQLDKVLEVRERCPTLKKIIIFDMDGLRTFDDPQCISFAALLELGREYDLAHPDAWQSAVDASQPEDLMVLTYTSGTTGRPKGAMLSHRNILFTLIGMNASLGYRDDDESLAFLPLAHVAGRIFYILAPIGYRCVVNLVESLETTVEDLQEVSPTTHFAVPRVWEKQYSTVTIKLKEGTAPGRWAYTKAIAIGAREAKYRMQNQPVPLPLRLQRFLAEFLVLKHIKQLLGIDRARWLCTGAAPIAPELIEWFWSIGCSMFEGWGQTECAGLGTCNTPDACRFGSVGKAMDGVEVKLSEQGELLIRSAGVISGYWNNPEKTAETIQGGWLYTGDVGRIDADGYVYVIDRIKDIIITAGGKNITPSEIENQLKFSPFISDAVVVGDAKPYLTCLVMIDQDNVTQFAQDENVPFTNYTSLCHTHAVKDLIWGEIEKVNAKFARVETIKKFRLIDQLLDAEDEELTPTMKLKRNVVNKKYRNLIDEMYGK